MKINNRIKILLTLSLFNFSGLTYAKTNFVLCLDEPASETIIVKAIKKDKYGNTTETTSIIPGSAKCVSDNSLKDDDFEVDLYFTSISHIEEDDYGFKYYGTFEAGQINKMGYRHFTIGKNSCFLNNDNEEGHLYFKSFNEMYCEMNNYYSSPPFTGITAPIIHAVDVDLLF